MSGRTRTNLKKIELSCRDGHQKPFPEGPFARDSSQESRDHREPPRLVWVPLPQVFSQRRAGPGLLLPRQGQRHAACLLGSAQSNSSDCLAPTPKAFPRLLPPVFLPALPVIHTPPIATLPVHSLGGLQEETQLTTGGKPDPGRERPHPCSGATAGLFCPFLPPLPEGQILSGAGVMEWSRLGGAGRKGEVCNVSQRGSQREVQQIVLGRGRAWQNVEPSGCSWALDHCFAHQASEILDG